jgi:DNA invertase Pin-like site-specific DNA recombinase
MMHRERTVTEMRVGIYARCSTTDKDQNPDTQVIPLREFCQAQGWTIQGEYVDRAPATDLRGRTAWRQLLDDAGKRKLDVVLVFRIDRAFRSVLDAATTVERLRGWKVGLRSFCEPWLDTTSAFGEALYYITAAYAQLERGILSERVKAGMTRAKKQGTTLGRPVALNGNLEALIPDLRSGALSCRQAAKQLGVTPSTVSRTLLRKGIEIAPRGTAPSTA